MDIAKLATQLAAGIITAETISATYGSDVLTQVLAYTLAGGAASAAGSAYDAADNFLDGTLGELGGAFGELFDW